MMQIYIHKEKNNYIFYLSFKKYKTIKEIVKSAVSHCCYYIERENETVTLLHLETNKHSQGRGYGDYLLKNTITYMKNHKYKFIELDDMSDRAWEVNNIYIKNNFEYVNDYPEPEMILLL